MKKSELKTIVAVLAQRVEILENSNKHYVQAINKHYKRVQTDLNTINKLENQAEQFEEGIRKLNSELSSRFDARVNDDELKTIIYGVNSGIHRIKLIRQITGWSLKESKNWYDEHLSGCTMQKFEEEEQV